MHNYIYSIHNKINFSKTAVKYDYDVSGYLYSKWLDSLTTGVVILSKEKHIIFFNSIVKSYDFNIENLLNHHFQCTIPSVNKNHCINKDICRSCILNAAINTVIKTEAPQRLDSFLLNTKNSQISLSLQISLINQSIFIEFLEYNKTNIQEDLLRKLLDKSKDIFFYKDSSFRYIYVNKSCCNFFGKDESFILNKKGKDLFPDEALYNSILRSDILTMENGKFSGVDVIDNRHFEVSKECINGGILGIVRDISKEVNLSVKANIDQLTNLYNRRYFSEVIDKIYENNESNYYLALIDMDDLRTLNNFYGHLKGDEYLLKFASILKKYCDKSRFFRIGGDEFAGLIKCSEPYIHNLFTNIFKDLKNLNLNPALTISVAVKKLSLEEDFLSNYDAADKFLYKIKKKGKNAFKLFK